MCPLSLLTLGDGFLNIFEWTQRRQTHVPISDFVDFCSYLDSMVLFLQGVEFQSATVLFEEWVEIRYKEDQSKQIGS